MTLPADTPFTLEWLPGKLNGIMEIRTGDLCFVPYYAWDNRAPGKMKVWVPLAE